MRTGWRLACRAESESARMLVSTDLPAKHEVADRGLGAAVPKTSPSRVRDQLQSVEAAEMAREEEARQSYMASLRSAQTAAERAVIDAVLAVGEAVEALYAIEQNLHAEGQPGSPPAGCSARPGTQ